MKETFKNISKEKRELIIKEAFLEFGEYGYEGASTNRLVKSIGISKGSLFKYFENKFDLFSYLLEIALEALLEFMGQYNPQGRTPKERLLEYAELEFDFTIEYPLYYRFFYTLQGERASDDLLPVMQKLQAQSMEMNTRLLDQVGVPKKEDLREHLILLITSYNRVFMSGVSRDVESKNIKQAFLDGLEKHLNFVNWRYDEETI